MKRPRQQFGRWTFAIFAVALAVRLTYLWQIRPSPFFDVLMGDARSYDAWATQIAGGDWIGRGVFYQAPLYPYLLGALYAIAGRSLLGVRIVQVVIGSAACVLLALAVRRFFSDRAGAIAGFGLALYAPAIFFDGLLQKSSVDIFLVCLALWQIGRLSETPRRMSWWLLLGVTMGALSLTRENAVVFAAVIPLWVMAGPKGPALRTNAGPKGPGLHTNAGPKGSALRTNQPSHKSQQCAAFVLGVSLMLAPVAIRNRMVAGEWHLTTAQFGPNLYLGNNPRAVGTPASLRAGRGSAEYEQHDAIELAEAARGRHLTPAEVSRYWSAQAVAFITSQPGAWLRLMARKGALLWNRTEWVDTESEESYEEWSPLLRAGAWIGHFGVLVPLALLGLIATWRERVRLWVLYLLIAAYAGSVAMFYVSARYRLPLVPFLILFAAAGVGSLPQVFRTHTTPHIASMVCAVALAAMFCNWPMLSKNLMRAITENNLGTALQDQQRLQDAVDHYRRAIAYQSDYAPAYNNLGVVLMEMDRPSEAVAAYEQAAALMPSYADPHYNLGNALLRVDKPADAADQFKKALALAPPSVDAYNNLGIALASADRPAEAIEAFRKALRLDSRSGRAHRNLGVVLLDEQRFPEAIAELHAAVDETPGSAETHNDLGMALGSTGRISDAIAEFEEALKLKPDFDEARRNLDIARETAARRSRAAAR